MVRLNETMAEANAAAHKYTDDGAASAGMYAALDGASPDDSKAPELAVMFLELIRRIVKPGNARYTANRFISLVLQLIPDALDMSQLAAAKQLGVSRAGLSKTGIVLTEELNLGHARWRKLEGTRGRYAEAQRRAFRQGRHASHVLKKRKLALAAIDTTARRNEKQRKTRTAHPHKSCPASKGPGESQHP